MDYSKITDVKIGGLDYSDAFDFCDAYIESAYHEGLPMTDKQLDDLSEDRDFVYKQIMKLCN